jgi:Family of unknown function (DUF5683)
MSIKNIFILIFACLTFTQLQAQQPVDSTVVLKRRGGAIAEQNDSLLNARIQKRQENIKIDTAIVANDSATVTIDSTKLVVKSKHPIRDFIKKDYPNPRKAALFSIIPGGGQLYNRSYWKIPLLYGSIIGMTALMINNNKQYQIYKVNYYNLVNDLPLPEPRFASVGAASLKNARDAARKNLELAGVIFGIGYLLFTAEAFVDAHLGTFDVSDDLSLKIKPTFTPNQHGTSAAGIGLAFNFK